MGKTFLRHQQEEVKYIKAMYFGHFIFARLMNLTFLRSETFSDTYKCRSIFVSLLRFLTMKHTLVSDPLLKTRLSAPFSGVIPDYNRVIECNKIVH